MKKSFLFLMSLLLFFAAGFFLDAVFRGWGVFTNVILLWFFIIASYRMLPYEILFAGWLTGFIYNFFAVGPSWFWFFVFFATSFAVLAAHSFAGASGRFRFLFFALAGWAGALLVRIIALFFSGTAHMAYGTVWNYVFSSALGLEIELSVALLFCVAAAAYCVGRKERIYYV